MSTNKGGKKKRRGKNTTNLAVPFHEPEEGQYFAKAIKPLGSNRVELEVYFYNIENKGKQNEKITFNKQIVPGCVRGSMRRRQYVNPGCIVLVSKREFSASQNIVDIILLYKQDHYYQIKKHKLVPLDITKSQAGEGEDGINFDFSDHENSNSDSDDTIDKIQYTKTVKKKRKNDKNEDYMAGIGMPSFDDEDVNLDAEVREVDSLGNFI
jgi:hypothetical protein